MENSNYESTNNSYEKKIQEWIDLIQKAKWDTSEIKESPELDKFFTKGHFITAKNKAIDFAIQVLELKDTKIKIAYNKSKNAVDISINYDICHSKNIKDLKKEESTWHRSIKNFNCSGYGVSCSPNGCCMVKTLAAILYLYKKGTLIDALKTKVIENRYAFEWRPLSDVNEIPEKYLNQAKEQMKTNNVVAYPFLDSDGEIKIAKNSGHSIYFPPYEPIYTVLKRNNFEDGVRIVISYLQYLQHTNQIDDINKLSGVCEEEYNRLVSQRQREMVQSAAYLEDQFAEIHTLLYTKSDDKDLLQKDLLCPTSLSSVKELQEYINTVNYLWIDQSPFIINLTNDQKINYYKYMFALSQYLTYRFIKENINIDINRYTKTHLNNIRKIYEDFGLKNKMCLSYSLNQIKLVTPELCVSSFMVNDDINYIQNNEQRLKDAEYDSLFTLKKSQIGAQRQKCPNCDFCKHQFCLYESLIAFYILDIEGQLNDAIARNTCRSDKYNFKWDCKNGVKYVPENIYQKALEIVNSGKIYVEPDLNEQNYIVANINFDCVKTEDFTNKGKIIENKTTVFLDPNKELINKKYCMHTACSECCLIAVTAYIVYMMELQQTELLNQDRLYYKEHPDEVKTHVLKIRDQEEKENNNKVKELLTPFKESIDNLQMLIDSICINSNNNLYAIIEREDGMNINEFVDAIKESLIIKNKIKEDDPIFKRDLDSFLEIMIQEADPYNDFLHKYKLDENKLCVFDRLRIPVKWEDKLDSVVSLEENTYVILIGTKKEFDIFFQDKPKIKCIFNNLRMVYKPLTIEAMYNLYKDQLAVGALEHLTNDPDGTKNKFFSYVETNRSIIALKNHELIEYLAYYSNIHGDIVFPADVYKKQTLEESLKNIIGLQPIKAKIKEVEKYVLFNNKIKSMGRPPCSSNMNMVFQGNPGTGKTTIARIMARMLFDIGVIKNNIFIEASRKDFIGKYIGDTEERTTTIIQKAMGGVLFIDEAYSLYVEDANNDSGRLVIAELIKVMEDHKDELIIIFAGYTNEMFDFLNSNPGLQSRIGYIFNFEDYSKQELHEIFELKAKQLGFTIDNNAIIKLDMIFEKIKKRKNFGNGRFIDNILQQVIINHAINHSDEFDYFYEDDIPSFAELITKEAEKELPSDPLKDMIGLQQVKEEFLKMEKYAAFYIQAKKMGLSLPNLNLHMIFKGNPGTGKTTVARKMADLLYRIGLLNKNKFIEASGKDLIGEYLGQTAPKTAKIIEQAMGGILFIDEAYTLTVNEKKYNYQGEAIAELIKQMEDHKGEFIVIFAGYEDLMDKFVESNPGIQSRIGYTFHFTDYTPDELAQICFMKLNSFGFIWEDEIETEVKSIMQYFASVPNIGNGRFVDKYIQTLLFKHSKNTNEINLIELNDLPSVEETKDVIFNGEDLIEKEKITDDILHIVAIHEIGHAYIQWYLERDTKIIKVTIESEANGQLGVVHAENSKQYLYNKTKLLNQIKIYLGGIANEEVYNGEYNNGCCSDLEAATHIAQDMVAKYGMSSLGFATIQSESSAVQQEVNKILNQCFQETKKILEQDKSKTKILIDSLQEKKTITGEEFICIMDRINSHDNTNKFLDNRP